PVMRLTLSGHVLTFLAGFLRKWSLSAIRLQTAQTLVRHAQSKYAPTLLLDFLDLATNGPFMDT
ncbi:MAG: hypothetical protein WBV21_00210, partial [Desulfobacterales bacterium]